MAKKEKAAKAEDFKGKSAEELKGMVADLKKEQFNLRFQGAAGETVSQGRIRELRKNVARILTQLNQNKKEA